MRVRLCEVCVPCRIVRVRAGLSPLSSVLGASRAPAARRRPGHKLSRGLAGVRDERRSRAAQPPRTSCALPAETLDRGPLSSLVSRVTRDTSREYEVIALMRDGDACRPRRCARGCKTPFESAFFDVPRVTPIRACSLQCSISSNGRRDATPVIRAPDT